jgi:hypothetical protein
MNKTLFNAVQAKDFHTANEQFAQSMAQKLAVRLAAERKTVSEDTETDNSVMEDGGDPKRFKTIGDPKPAPKAKSASFGVKCQECGKKFKTRSMLPDCPKCGGSDIDLSEAHIKEAIAGNDPALPLLTHSSVQKIYDATGDIHETELLCGVKNLITSGDSVVSFVGIGQNGMMEAVGPKSKFEVGDRVKYSGSALESSRQYYLGLGDYSRKNAAKADYEKKLAMRGTVTDVSHINATGNLSHSGGAEVKWDDNYPSGQPHMSQTMDHMLEKA